MKSHIPSILWTTAAAYQVPQVWQSARAMPEPQRRQTVGRYSKQDLFCITTAGLLGAGCLYAASTVEAPLLASYKESLALFGLALCTIPVLQPLYNGRVQAPARVERVLAYARKLCASRP